jgi:hypothetical protein
MNTRANIAPRLNCERLESRDNPDGNVAVAVSNGTIFLQGDVFNNRVVLEQNQFGDVFVTGLNNTTVNGVTSIWLGRGIPNGVVADMGGGGDRTEVLGLTVNNNIEILAGSGNDSTFLLNNRLGGAMVVNSTDGNDDTWVSGVFASVVILEGDTGFDRFHIDNAFTNSGVFVFNMEQQL